MKKVDQNILALGEITGHYHQAVGEGVTVFDLDDGTRILNAPAGASITHQEHGAIAIPPGEYVRTIVVESDPFSEEIRAVRD